MLRATVQVTYIPTYEAPRLSQRARLRRRGKAHKRTSLALDEVLRARLAAEVSRRKDEGRSADLGQVIREACLAYLEDSPTPVRCADSDSNITPIGSGRLSRTG